jgi:hypothetical protein
MRTGGAPLETLETGHEYGAHNATDALLRGSAVDLHTLQVCTDAMGGALMRDIVAPVRLRAP